MADKLELSDWDFKTAMSIMLMVLMDKVDGMKEQMGNTRRKMEILRIKKKC